MKRTTTVAAIILLSCAAVTAQPSSPFFFNYVIANYTCRAQSKANRIKFYSQVYSACFADGIDHDHIAIAKAGNSLSITDQQAKIDCPGGSISSVELRNGDAHSGPNARERVEADRKKAMADSIESGAKVESFYVAEAVYSKTSCK